MRMMTSNLNIGLNIDFKRYQFDLNVLLLCCQGGKSVSNQIEFMEAYGSADPMKLQERHRTAEKEQELKEHEIQEMEVADEMERDVRLAIDHAVFTLTRPFCVVCTSFKRYVGRD